mgnify:CR=1 FL=1
MHFRTEKSLLVLLASLALLGLTACAVPSADGGSPLTSAELSRLRSEQQQFTEQLTTLSEDLSLVKSQLAGQEVLIADLQQEVLALSEGAPSRSSKPTEENPAGNVGSLSPTEVYQRSFAEYASGRYGQSTKGFQQFLRAFPDSRYAGNAQYWLAESLYKQQEFGKAITAYEAVVKRYAQGGKAPEALYRLAVIHNRLRQQDKAQEYVDRLQNLYPESSAAKKALQGEGF